MNSYESMYIIKAGLEDAKREAIIERFGALVEKSGGANLKVDKWGSKRFAYPIDFKNEGYYVLMTFESAPEFPRELERQFRITDEVVRFIVVRK